MVFESDVHVAKNKMALKETIETWHLACCLLDDLQFQKAATKLRTIENPSAKIIHNLGCLLMLQKLFTDAAQTFKLSIEKDNHLALSYFTRGLSYHHMGRLAEAEADFNSAKVLIKGDDINYKQLGAPIVLATNLVEECLAVTKDCARNKPKALPVISITDCVFRPPKKMVDNLIKQDFLGKSKVVSSAEDKVQHLSVQSTMIHQSSSLPSSPVTSRHRNSPALGNKNFPAPPTRPPPRFRRELTSTQSNETSSKSGREPAPAHHEYEDVIQSNHTHGKNSVYSLAKVFSSEVTPNGTPFSAASDRPNLHQSQQQVKSQSVGPYSVTVLQQHSSGSATLQWGPLSPPPPIPNSLTSQHKRHLPDVMPYKVSNLNVSATSTINAGPTRAVLNTTQQNFSATSKPVQTASNQPGKKPMRPPPPKLENKG